MLVDPAELAFNLLLSGLQLLAEPREVGVPESGLSAFLEDGLLEVVPVQIGFQDLYGSGGSLPANVAFLQEPFQRLYHASVIDDVVEFLDVAFGHPDGFVLLLEFQDVGNGVIGFGHIEFLRMLAVVVAPYPVGKNFLVEQRVQQLRQILAGQFDEDLGLQVVIDADGPEGDEHPVLPLFILLENGRRLRLLQGDIPRSDAVLDLLDEAVQFRQVAGAGEVFVPFLSLADARPVAADGFPQGRSRILQLAGAAVFELAAAFLPGSDPRALGRKDLAELLIYGTLGPLLV